MDVIAELAPSWVFFIAIIAAAAAHLDEIDFARPWRDQVRAWLARCGISIFAAIMSYQLFAKILMLKPEWLVWFVGIGAHMGTEAIREFRARWKKYVTGESGGKPDGQV